MTRDRPLFLFCPVRQAAFRVTEQHPVRATTVSLRRVWQRPHQQRPSANTESPPPGHPSSPRPIPNQIVLVPTPAATPPTHGSAATRQPPGSAPSAGLPAIGAHRPELGPTPAPPATAAAPRQNRVLCPTPLQSCIARPHPLA